MKDETMDLPAVVGRRRCGCCCYAAIPGREEGRALTRIVRDGGSVATLPKREFVELPWECDQCRTLKQPKSKPAKKGAKKA